MFYQMFYHEHSHCFQCILKYELLLKVRYVKTLSTWAQTIDCNTYTLSLPRLSLPVNYSGLDINNNNNVLDLKHVVFPPIFSYVSLNTPLCVICQGLSGRYEDGEMKRVQ